MRSEEVSAKFSRSASNEDPDCADDAQHNKYVRRLLDAVLRRPFGPHLVRIQTIYSGGGVRFFREFGSGQQRRQSCFVRLVQREIKRTLLFGVLSAICSKEINEISPEPRNYRSTDDARADTAETE